MKRTVTLVVAQTIALGLLPFGALAATFQLEEATVSEINKAFDAGAITSEQLIELYLNRIDTYDDSLNSIITVNSDALEIARALDIERQTTGPRSPLHGIPVILKDNYDTFDLPTTGGSITLEGSIPPDDAFLVKQLRDAGAIILAKANLSEFASSGGRDGYSSFGGQTLNPYNLVRGPAGSSGGTGAAIAANFGVIGTGSDTGGSIRSPSAHNGLVGIKPTLGLLSRDGIIPLALSFDTGGPMTRTVEDAAIALGIMTGIDPADPVTLESEGKFFKDYTQFLDKNALQGARIGVLQNFLGGNVEVDQLFEDAVDQLTDLGATIVETSYSKEFLEERSQISTLIFDSEFQPQIEAYLATLEGDYPKTLEEILAISTDPDVVNSDRSVAPGRIESYRRNLASGGLTNPDYIDAVENGIPLVRKTVLDLMDSNDLDALIYPTRNCPAVPIYTVEDPTYICDETVPAARNIANITGFPDVQVPMGFTSDGLPLTISLFGRAFSEPTLLGYAYAYEQTTKFRSPPPLFPALPGEEIEYETVPEPGMIPALAVLGISALGIKFVKRRNGQPQGTYKAILPVAYEEAVGNSAVVCVDANRL
ncbi:amidase [Trichocoleus sp. FACHB-69]|uniref:amidase family protein n=2 Tax=Cyanophyceae TaxID=3028117 RepID=UPI001688F359|nr:amidase family protein [Trichocoleus sp. FACHB-69]MBD1932608.1 amidase [Trichocoleus sp. FACHB-69]